MSAITPHGKERRQHPRFRVDQAIQYSFGHENYLSCRGVDFSEGGLRIETPEPLEYGTRLFVMFEPGDDREPISCEAVVVHAEPQTNQEVFTHGIKFIDISDDDRGRLRSLLKGGPPA